jgi:hypothetical protein
MSIKEQQISAILRIIVWKLSGRMCNERLHVQRQSAAQDLFQRREVVRTQPVGGSLAVAVPVPAPVVLAPVQYVDDVYLAHVRLQRVANASKTSRQFTLKLHSSY